MKSTALFLLVVATAATLCHAVAITPSSSTDVCNKPADVVYTPHSAKKLCSNAICVDLGTATLLNNGSQICQESGQPQGAFACTDRSEYVLIKTRILYQTGQGTCAIPSKSSTFAQYACDNGAKINVFTKKDGTASFYISRLSKDAPGVAGYESASKGRKNNCKPRGVIGTTNIVNDKLIIDCEGFEKVCPVEE